MEGERLTSALFGRYAGESVARQQAQLGAMDGFALLSPVIALRRLSMGAAGTDLQAYQRFLAQGEQHRYALVQALNRMQAEKLTLATDRNTRESRIGKDHWQGLAAFRFDAEPAADILRRAVPMAAVLLAWLGALGAVLVLATRRLDGAVR
jgi:ABC-2 type transport system permease protein